MPDKGHEAADKELKRLEQALAKHYAQAAKELTKKAEAFMRDFERKDTQMQKLVEAGKMTEQDYMNWRRNQMMTEERIQDMKDQLTQDLVHADQIAAGMINDTLPNAYAENFNFGTYEIETGTTIDTSFTLYDKKTVENLMKKDPKIIPKARVDIPKDELWNRQKLTSAIAQGILQGESIPKIATRLQNVAEMDRNAAIRNARTYTTAAENKGRVDSIARANEMGIPSDQEWIAVLDDRTRMEHRHLDGQVRPVGEPFSADGYRIMYPGDPDAEPEMIYNCRCTLVSRVRGRIYNDERNDSKLDGMSYEEWKHAKDRQMEPPNEEPKQEKKKEENPNAWIDRIKELQASEPTLESVKEAGEIIKTQVQNSETIQRMHEIKEERAILENKMQEESQKLNALLETDPKYKDAYDVRLHNISVEESKFFDSMDAAREYFEEVRKPYDEARLAFWDYDKKVTQDEIAENLKGILSQVRDMGSAGLDIKGHFENSRLGVFKNLAWAVDKYPTSWVQRSIERGSITVEKGKRGFYRDLNGTICISGTKESANETAIHEMAHRFEHTINGILKEEKMFYNERTEGEELVWLGKGYDKDELTRKDDFLDPYMGKSYNGRAYELASMGFEYAYTNPDKLAKDPDMESFIYGMLATIN